MTSQSTLRAFHSFVVLISIFFSTYAQDYSAGINTENPSPFAVLHLVAPNGDQGLLIPSLTTLQRNALTSVMSANENGLLVFDQDEAHIYFWQNSQWVALVQTFSKSGNTISLTNGGSINIGEGVPVAGQILQWDGANWVPANPAGAQTLNLAGSILDISNGNSVDLSSLIDDADPDPTNENQTVSGGTGINVTQSGQDFNVTNTLPDVVVNITDGGSGNLAISGTYPNFILDVPNVDDADADPLNEIQTISGGPGITVTQTGQDFNVTNSLPDQVVNLSAGSTNVTIGGGYPNFIVDVPSLDDADNVIGNEFQDLSLAGNILTLSDDATTVDLSAFLDNTDDQIIDQFDLTGSTINLSLEADGVAPLTVDLSTFSLPALAGNAGSYLTTDGSVSLWSPLGALAQLNTVGSNEITDLSITETDLANSIAGDGIAGGAGIPLSVDLAANSGMNFNTNQLQMEELYPGGITYDGGASTAIRSITFDSKGRFLSATSVTVVLSDRRLKKEITHLDNSLEKIMQLNGYNYYLKSDSLNKELKTGVMAQEIKEVIPNLLLTRPDGYYGVDYQGLIPILLEAIKEQQQIIENMKTDLSHQERTNQDQDLRITAMEGKLEQLLELMSVNE